MIVVVHVGVLIQEVVLVLQVDGAAEVLVERVVGY